MNSNNTYNVLNMNLIKDFKKACATYGPAPPFCREYLARWSNDTGPLNNEKLQAFKNN
jgi:hypothetical protein